MKFLLVIAVLVAAGCGYYFLYPPVVMQRQVDTALKNFAAAVESQDRAKVSAVLQERLVDTAQIHLEVDVFNPLRQGETKPAVQDFDKPTFIHFIDNILYASKDYHYTPQLTSFTLSPDKKSAAVTFESKEYADGDVFYSGTAVTVRYSADTTCSGQVSFDHKQAFLEKASCAMQLRFVPKAEEMYKLRNPEAMREFLR